VRESVLLPAPPAFPAPPAPPATELEEPKFGKLIVEAAPDEVVDAESLAATRRNCIWSAAAEREASRPGEADVRAEDVVEWKGGPRGGIVVADEVGMEVEVVMCELRVRIVDCTFDSRGEYCFVAGVEECGVSDWAGGWITLRICLNGELARTDGPPPPVGVLGLVATRPLFAEEVLDKLFPDRGGRFGGIGAALGRSISVLPAVPPVGARGKGVIGGGNDAADGYDPGIGGGVANGLLVGTDRGLSALLCGDREAPYGDEALSFQLTALEFSWTLRRKVAALVRPPGPDEEARSPGDSVRRGENEGRWVGGSSEAVLEDDEEGLYC
jgi:hypothetical protein